MSERNPLSEGEREAALKDIRGPDLEAIVEAAKLLSADRSTTARLLQLLEIESRVESRHGILYALTWHADLSLWDLMVRILADPREDPKVRGQAAEGLAYLFSQVSPDSKEFEVAVRTLRDALKDPSPEVRYCAVFAIGATSYLPLVPVLQEVLEDKTPVPGWPNTIGEQAREALEFMTRDPKGRNFR